MHGSIWDGIVHFVSVWGSNPLVDLLVGSLLTLAAVFFRKIGHFFSRLFAWLWAIVHKRGKDYTFEKAYLNWIINRHRYLGMLPARIVAARWGEGRRIVDLEKVYVTLQVSTQGGDQGWADTQQIASSSWCKQPWFYTTLLRYRYFYTTLLAIAVLIPVALIIFHFTLYFWLIAGVSVGLLALIFFIRPRVLRQKDTYQPNNLALAIDRHKQLVIRGDPGSGKTTLLRYLAVTCARSLRNDRKQGDAPDMIKKRLLWTARPFPILVTLRLHNDVMYWGEKKQLIDTFFEEMPVELRKQYPEGFFERKLKQGNCLILLDAFDELGSPEARAAMAHRIGGFLDAYDHPRNRFVVTTRIVGYEGQLDQYDFQRRTVQNLHVGEIRALIKQRYRAIGLSETSGWQAYDAAPVLQDMRQRSERLIRKIESTPRLAQLATNPLLLSLIVLVHYVKLELPEERVLLYRDCVEILAEQWQRAKRAEIGVQQEAQEDLTLPQKLVLLQEIALHMQQQRTEEDRQTLLPQREVQEVIAAKLPDILGSQLSGSKHERREACRRKAEAWVKNIQVDSGILVEQGLDEAGEPLIGFSHLTFQEYLTAVAINETAERQHLLESNLLQPVWREAVLLYVALADDATPTLALLLAAPDQPAGILLAGFCLAEKVKRLKNDIRLSIMEKIKIGFEQADDITVMALGRALTGISGGEVTTFMRGQLHSTMLAKRLEVVKSLGQIKSNDVQLRDVQQELVELLEMPNDVAVMIAARESLAQIGDPRFTSKEPVMVSIPRQTCSMSSSPKNWKELFVSPEWTAARLRSRFLLLSRVFDYWCFTRFHPLRQRLPQKHAFTISKYLVTNIEYARFITATGHDAPEYWVEGAFPTKKATHPVTDITVKDAKAYCKWLTRETGKTYRLPTEWEWEWAAAGPHGWQYPWGDQFDKDKCNNTNWRTTPVGSYLADTSQYGVTDMCGNVYELTQGYMALFLSFLFFCYFFLSLGFLSLFLSFLSLFLPLPPVFLPLLLPLDFSSLFLSLLLLLLSLFLLYLLKSLSFFVPCVLRGGAFYTPLNEAKCFSRKNYWEADDDIGFRCVKEA